LDELGEDLFAGENGFVYDKECLRYCCRGKIKIKKNIFFWSKSGDG
jgi:hypothetical protein